MAYLFRDPRQFKKLGDACPWSVRWVDPNSGKTKSKTIGSRTRAKNYARQLEGKIRAGEYDENANKTWQEFITEYRSKVLGGAEPATASRMEFAIRHFERIIKPARLKGITTKTFAEYVAKRRTEPRKKDGPLVRPATINAELRCLRAIIRKAYRWNYIRTIPGIDFLKEPQKLPTYITPEDFAKLYAAAENARLPSDLPYPAGDWWQGLLVMAYMTGWRIGALLALRREDVDLERGYAVSRGEDNKGKRDQQVPLHPLVVEHLRRLPSLSSVVFPWELSRRTLHEVFIEIQRAAGVKPPAIKAHYGFHDLRRSFATLNADRMTPDALQHMMQHRDYQTTQRYVALARQLSTVADSLYVPDLKVPKVG